MNKTIVDEEIALAREALIECKIANNNKIVSTYRGCISTFGAALTMGSVTSAVAFYSRQGAATVDRTSLLKAITYILRKRNVITHEQNLIDYVLNSKKTNEEAKAKEEMINAATAIKLAMNLFELEKDKKGN